ncbi:hypothetical protein PSP6_300003 [Paraburkholderia tropica]|nr:hypothetical protein PSP6_300003 [Paraburkholderia tropica]
MSPNSAPAGMDSMRSGNTTLQRFDAVEAIVEIILRFGAGE